MSRGTYLLTHSVTDFEKLKNEKSESGDTSPDSLVLCQDFGQFF